MSSPATIPRSTKRLSTSSISSSSSSSSYNFIASSSSSLATSPANSAPSSPKTAAKGLGLGLYVPVHKRSPSPSVKALPQETSKTYTHTYTIPHLLSLRPLAHEGMKDKLRSGPAPELVMNRKMRKNLEFAESQHRRVSPVSATVGLPAVPSTPTPAPVHRNPTPTTKPNSKPTTHPTTETETKTTPTQRIPARSRTRLAGRARAGLNLASWRNAVPVGVAPSVAFV